MTPAPDHGTPTADPWRRNLFVCTLGSFTTIIGMTLILPVLPLYVARLGVADPGAVAVWSGAAYAATFLTAALTAPLWGMLGDRYGRKPMLIRASLGMAVAMSLIGFAQSPEQLVVLRLIAGLLGGYASGSTILVAAQTPRRHAAWALGVLSSGIMAGNVVGPLLGGVLAATIGVQNAFLATGGLIFVAFVGTAVFIVERPRASGRHGTGEPAPQGTRRGWADVPSKPVVAALLGLSSLLTFAIMSVEPIVTLHVARLARGAGDVALLSAVVFSVTALGAVLSGPWLGRWADHVGHLRVLITSLAVAAVALLLQSAAPEPWSFAALRFVTGLALGGVMPTVVASIRALVPESSVGTVLGVNVSAQYVGQVSGPLLAGLLGAAAGTNAVFVATAGVVLVGLLAAIVIRRPLERVDRS